MNLSFCCLKGCFHLIQDGAGEFVGGSLTTHITSSNNTGKRHVSELFRGFDVGKIGCGLPLSDDVVDSLRDTVGVVIQSEVTEEHGAGEDQGSWVSLVLALDVETDVSAARFKDSNISTHVASWDNTGASNKSGTDVGEDATVQVRHDHDVELLGVGDSLHRGVVDDHIVRLESGVALSNLLEGASEQTVSKLHDICLVDTGDLLPVVGKSEAEGELGDTLRFGAGDDLEGFNDAVD